MQALRAQARFMRFGLYVVIFSGAALFATSANAWFFFFIPGSVTSKISDALTGEEGENCVTETAKVGDVLHSPTGNTATIKSLSGKSSRCKDPHLPIRALLEFTYSFSSKAGMDVPENYSSVALTQNQRFQGYLLHGENSSDRTGFFVTANKRANVHDPAAMMHAIAQRMGQTLNDVQTDHEEQLEINGENAWRFELSGKTKGVFGTRFTYVVTALQGDDEYVVVTAWSTTFDYENQKTGLKSLAGRITGIRTNKEMTTVQQAPVTGAAGTAQPQQQETKTAVVPSDAATPTPSVTPTPTATSVQEPSQDIAKRLRVLDNLLNQGLITKDEYQAKREAILKGI